MIPQSSLCSEGDGHGVTEGRKRGNREAEEAKTVKEEMHCGLLGSKAKEQKTRTEKNRKSKRFSILP